MFRRGLCARHLQLQPLRRALTSPHRRGKKRSLWGGGGGGGVYGSPKRPRIYTFLFGPFSRDNELLLSYYLDIRKHRFPVIAA